jgi:hypothetical protein
MFPNRERDVSLAPDDADGSVGHAHQRRAFGAHMDARFDKVDRRLTNWIVGSSD